MGGDAEQGCLHFLVHVFSLVVGLGAEGREDRLTVDPRRLQNSFQKARAESRPPVRDDISGEAVQVKKKT